MRIRIQYFRSMRIRIQIKTFDDQKFKKRLSSIKSLKFLHCSRSRAFFALLDPDPDPVDQNQCGSIRIRNPSIWMLRIESYPELNCFIHSSSVGPFLKKFRFNFYV
jgi:hypothetical protein